MTTADQASELLKSLPWYVFAGGPVVLAAALAFLSSRLSFTKKERADFEQDNYNNTTRLIDQHDDLYDKYTNAISAYTESDNPSFDLFKNIAICGDRYFIHACLICDAILSGKVDTYVRDNTLLPRMSDIANRTLPQHYNTLQSIAKDKGWPYKGELRRKDYSSIFSVVEKFPLLSS